MSLKMSTEKTPLWRQIQRKNFTSLEALSSFLQIPEEDRAHLLPNPRFPINVPLRLAEKMEKGSIQDPLFLQFVPQNQEGNTTPGFTLDPVQDADFCRTSKLLQKYPGRALLIVSSACAMHCRYCFRQNFDYPPLQLGFQEELACIELDPSIEEVILSGGDPLSVSDTTLAQLLDSLEAIPHVRRLRIHTRFPIGIPERIDPSFLETLVRFSGPIYFVLHSNHPREWDENLASKMRLLRRQGVILLNQTVLLKGVNDSIATQEALCRLLANEGIQPYYLHQLDPIEGAAHFEIPLDYGKQIVQELRGRLSGYAVPLFVKEIPHRSSKTVI